MPRFFFHLSDDLFVEDEEGMLLPDVRAAYEVGVQNARLMAAEEVIAGKLHLNHKVEIADEEGRIVCTVTFKEAFEIVG